jgi:hypothetical protein
VEIDTYDRKIQIFRVRRWTSRRMRRKVEEKASSLPGEMVLMSHPRNQRE